MVTHAPDDADLPDLGDLTPPQVAQLLAELQIEYPELEERDRQREQRAERERRAEAERRAAAEERQRREAEAARERREREEVETAAAEAQRQEADRIEAERRGARILVEHDGESVLIRSASDWHRLRADDDRLHRLWLSPEWMDRAAAKGTITNGDGVPLDPDRERRVRYRLQHDLDPETDWINTRHGAGRDRGRWLIPDLLRFGHKPLVTGNPKAGKSLLMTEITAAVTIPGRRLLDHFPPAGLTEGERAQGVWLVNAKHPAEDFENMLAAAGVDLADVAVEAALRVVHLEEEGGAASMDLTDPDVFARWEARLPWCEDCLGQDDQPPIALLVDDVLAILLAAGKDENWVGLWLAQYRRLTAGIPVGAVSSHATLQGSHAIGGVTAQAVMDGLWTYSADRPDDPHSARTFSVRPSAGSVEIGRTRVGLGDDGRLRIEPGRPRRSDPTAPTPVVGPASEAPTPPTPTPQAPTDDRPPPSVGELIVGYVARANAAGHGPSLGEVRANVPGPNPAVDAELGRLREAGRLDRRTRVGRGGGHAYWLAGGSEPEPRPEPR